MRFLLAPVLRLLRWSERYTKVDMVYLFRGGAILSAADAGLAIVSLALSTLIAAYVPKDIYGIYRYVLSVAGIAAAFSLTGMNTAVTRAVALGHEGAFAKSLRVQLRYAVLQFLIAAAVAAYYFVKENTAYGIAFTVVAVLAPLSGVANTYTAYLNGKKDFPRMALWRTESGLLNAAAMAGAVLFAPSLVGLTLAYCFSVFAVNAWLLWRTFRVYKPNRVATAEDLSYGKHLSIMNGVNTLASQLDSILIYHLLGPVQLALYTFATLIPERARSSFSFLPSLIIPRLAGRSRAEIRATLNQRTWLAIGAGVVLMLVYCAAVPFIFALFFPTYLDAVPYAVAAGFIILVTAGAKYGGTAMMAEGAYKPLYYASLATPAVKTVLSLACIPFFGIWGAIAARVIAGAFGGVLSYLLLQTNIGARTADGSTLPPSA